MPAFKDWKQVQTQAQLMETCVAAASPSRPTPSRHLPCRGMLTLSGVLACSVLSRMRSLPTSLTLPLNMVSRGAPTRLRPPAWSSRASRACVSRASGQAGRYADRQGGVRSARQTPRQADRQASTSQAVLSTLHHHPPSAPTAKHGCYTYYNILWHGWQAVQVLQAEMWLRPNTTGAGGAAAHSSSSLHAYQRQHLVWLRQRQFEVPAPVVVLCRVAGTADKAIRAQQQHKEHIQCPAQTSTKHASSSPVLFGRAALPCSRLSRCPGVQHDLQMAQELATIAINMYVAARWTAARFSGPFNLPLCKCASPMHSVVTLCCHCDIIPLCVKCLDNKVQYSHRRRLLHTAANSTCCCCCCTSRQLSSCCCARSWQGRITTCQTGR